MGVIFKPPQASFNLFIEDFLRLYEQLSSNLRQDLVICGDFNIDLLAYSSTLFLNNKTL